jgi:GNAT superfamily N-acetyltransferase
MGSLQERLEDSSGEALPELDDLLERMLNDRGYAIEDPVAREGDDREIMAEFLAAREITRLLDERPDAISPGDVAAAVNGYRSLGLNAMARDVRALETRLVAFRAEHAVGFRSLVADTLREFGFEPDPVIDTDLADPGATYAALWVALAGDEVVGSIALRDRGGNELELKRMYLRPKCRGRGVGRLMLAAALDWARQNGARKIKLDTTERMEAARHLYEAAGFVRAPGEAPRQGQRRLLYELEL